MGEVGPYLTANELAALTGYQANQFARMRRWLEAGKWPFVEPGPSGCPRVLRAYHDQRLSGAAVAAPRASNDAAFNQPNAARLQALQQHRGRKAKNA
jgi:hypothetical protein